MTKQQEIEWLDKTIRTLGESTYIGATLADQRESIIADIRNDIAPLQLAWLRKSEVEARALYHDASKSLTEKTRELEALRASIDCAKRQLQNLSKTLRSFIEASRNTAEYATTTLTRFADL
jgi:uncharacterized protein YukE